MLHAFGKYTPSEVMMSHNFAAKYLDVFGHLLILMKFMQNSAAYLLYVDILKFIRCSWNKISACNLPYSIASIFTATCFIINRCSLVECTGTGKVQ